MRLFAVLSVLGFCIVSVLFLINPSPVTIKGILLYVGLIFFLFAKEKYLIYISMFMVLCPVHLRYVGTTSNGIILILALILLFRSLVSQKSILSFKRITTNPFFIPGLLILCSYFISWIWAFLEHYKGMSYHTEFLISMFCVFILSNIIIGFVDSKAHLLGIQNILLVILIVNLLFAIATLIKPELKFILLSTSGSVITGGEDLRLGGLTFRWEAFAEYLMMSVVFFTCMLTKGKDIKYKYLLLTLLFVVVIELFLTNTRGAVVTSLLGIVFIILFFTKFNPIRKTAIMVGISFLVLAGAYIADSTGFLNLKERFQTFENTVETKYGSMPEARAGTWVPSLDQIVDDSFMGHGPSFHPLSGYEGGFGKMPWPHNLTLIILVTVGIYGLIAYCFLFFRFLISIIKITKITDKYSAIFYKSLWIALLMFFVDAQKFDGALRQSTSYFYFIWMIVALLFTSYNIALNNQN